MTQTNNLDIKNALTWIKKNKKLALTAGGFGLAIIGLFLPWYEVNLFGSRITASPGLNSTGLLIAIAAVVGGGAALNVLDKDKQQMKTVATVSSILMLLIVARNYPDSDFGAIVSIGYGYWICAIGSVAAVAGVLSSKEQNP